MIDTPTPALSTGGREKQWQPVMRSPMNAIHQKLGAEMAIVDGWEVPRRYQDVERERTAARNGLGIADITARGKIDIRGSLNAALAAVSEIQAAIPARVSRNWALVMTPPAQRSSSLDRITHAADPNAMVTDATSVYAGLALIGPRVNDLLARVITLDPSVLPTGGCVATQMLRLPTILLRPRSPLNVVEAFVPTEFGRYAWEAMNEIAVPLDAIPVGWDALQAEGWS